MANILSLGMKINADASGFKLDPVQRALRALAAEADKVSKVFDEFTGTSEAAARAQAKTAAELERLTKARQAGTIGVEEFAKQFAAVEAAANKEADALRRAAQITEQNLSSQERAARVQRELAEQLQAGRISQETYDRALAKTRTTLDATTTSVDKQKLKFNELSGVLAAIPGPFGSIAGRISGLASAGEGLSRVFSGGLAQGFSGIGASVAALVNPFTLAIGAIAGLGAAASSVVSGLTNLEDRVEKLGNTADKLGVSFEFVQVLDEAARRSGTSIDAVSAAFGRLQRSVLGVDEESKAAQKALAEIGVTAEELQSLSPEEQYQRIGQAIAAIEDPARRTATATALFGRQGAELTPFFNNIGKATTDMERFGAALSDVDRARIDGLGDAFDGVFVSLQGLGQTLLTPFAGLVDGVATAVSAAIGKITEFIKPFLDAITPALDAAGRAFEFFASSITTGSTNITQSLGPIGQIFQNIFDVLSAAVDSALPGIQSAFAAITDTVAELGRIFSDSFNAVFQALSDLGSSVARLLGFGGDLSEIGTTIGRVFGSVYETMGQVASVIGDVIGVINRFATIVVVALTKAATAVVDAVSGFLEFSGIGEVLSNIGEVISDVFGGIIDVLSKAGALIFKAAEDLAKFYEGLLNIQRASSRINVAENFDKTRAATAELTEEEKKQAAEREKFFASFASSVSKAADEAAVFGQAGLDAALQYQSGIEELRRKLDKGILNETSFKQEAAKAKAVFDDQLEIIKDSVAQTEAITKRVDALLAKANEIPQIEQDLNAIEAEIARVEAAAVAARGVGRDAEADALTRRLAELDQLQAGLQQQADEAAQGFSEGFDAAFANVNNGIGSLIDKASEFGQEGFNAALQLQDGIAKAQEQVKDGILNKQAFDAEVARQKELFENRVADLRRAEEITKRISEQQQQLADRQFEIELERAQELATVRSGSIQINDLREGGISAFFDALKEDPAISEARKQTKELENIRRELAKLQAEKVDILAGTG